jgi:ABC-type transport system substrate-binding protein
MANNFKIKVNQLAVRQTILKSKRLDSMLFSLYKSQNRADPNANENGKIYTGQLRKKAGHPNAKPFNAKFVMQNQENYTNGQIKYAKKMYAAGKVDKNGNVIR